MHQNEALNQARDVLKEEANRLAHCLDTNEYTDPLVVGAIRREVNRLREIEQSLSKITIE